MLRFWEGSEYTTGVVSSPMFTKARSGLVVVPQQDEQKLRGCLGSSSSVRS